MADRERKRQERRKRKERGGAAAPDARERMRSGYARAEEKNQAVREQLKPLGDGERPGVVTIASVISAVLAASIMIGYAAGAEVDGNRPAFVQALAPAFLMGVMAWGLWRARYWAVLGFQLILLFLIFSAFTGLALQAASALQILGTGALLAVSLTLFVLMIKAMARIQMPTREPR